MACDAASHITGSPYFGHGYALPPAQRLFCPHRRLQRWLTVEAALAASQAELGMIPADAAKAIADSARLETFDRQAVAQGIRRSNHSLMALLEEWQRHLEPAAAGFLHYGATTQDIQDTAQSLELADGLDLVHGEMIRLAGVLARLVADHRRTVMIGRTHGQPALPITFGLKAAGWLEELHRNHQRLTELRPRLLVAQLFGGVGTMASFGDLGPRLLEVFSQRLGLGVPGLAWHAARDRTAELTAFLALVAGGCARLAGEVAQLSRYEIGEVEEPFHPGKVGSSTMPHKRNPETCEQVVVLFRLVRSLAGLGFDTLDSEHERDYRAVRLEWVSLADGITYTATALALTREIAQGLIVHHQRMAANAAGAGALVNSEALMFRLAPHLGKQAAHRLLYDIAMEAAQEGRSYQAALLDNPTIRRYVDGDEVEELLRPEHYTGMAETLALRALTAAHPLIHHPLPNTAPCPLAGDDGGCRLQP